MGEICTTYILSNKNNNTLYIGVTSKLEQRVWQHKNKVADGFSKKYNVDKLVYYEIYDDMENAIRREKRLKKYRREAKVKLIESKKPNWNDLYLELF